MDHPTSDWGPHKAGTRYRVVRGFTDYDRDRHAPGEEWLFVGSSFLPYEDGLSLFVREDGATVRQIRLRCTPEDQGPITSALETYLAPID